MSLILTCPDCGCAFEVLGDEAPTEIVCRTCERARRRQQALLETMAKHALGNFPRFGGSPLTLQAALREMYDRGYAQAIDDAGIKKAEGRS